MTASVESHVIRVLADPLRLLTRGRLCTTHLVEQAGTRKTDLSQHLRVLHETGPAAAEPRGRSTYRRLMPGAPIARSAGFARPAAQDRATDAAGFRRACS